MAALRGALHRLRPPGRRRHAMATVKALNSARQIADAAVRDRSADYPGGGFADRLKDVARLVKAKVGLRVATIDARRLGHAHQPRQRRRRRDAQPPQRALADALGAFATDLGPQLDDVTLVTMTEFGRRVAENGNAGTDHGHGGLMMLLGGGLVGGQVHGKWPGLAPDALDNGDLAGRQRLPRRARRGARARLRRRRRQEGLPRPRVRPHRRPSLTGPPRGHSFLSASDTTGLRPSR